MDLFGKIREHIQNIPEHVMFQRISSGIKEEVTVAQVGREIQAISQYLSKSGVQPGDVVGILMENHPRWVTSFFAAVSAGCAVVPFDILHESETLAYLVGHSECKFLFGSEKTSPQIEEILEKNQKPLPVLINGDSGGRFPEFDDVLSQGGYENVPIPLVDRDENEPQIIMYTSGTTGNPKGVVLSGHSLWVNIQAALKNLNVTDKDHFLNVLPMYHILALAINCIVPLYSGARCTTLDVLDAQKIIKTFREEGITVFVCVPQFYYLMYRRIQQNIEAQSWMVRWLFNRLLGVGKAWNRMAGVNLSRKLLKKVHEPFGAQFRYFGVGAARFDPLVAQSMTDLGFDLVQAYGMTETAAISSMTLPDGKGVGSVGRPLPHAEFKIHNPNSEGIGEVYIRGIHLMKGYLKNEEATRETLDSEGWLHSGDLGYLDQDGYLHITGRAKDVIVLSSGKNIYPEEIEHFYQERCEFVKEICVIGIDAGSDVGHETLHGVVVPDFDELKRQGVVNASEMIRYLLETISQKLPSHKRVMSFEVWQQPLPRTTTKKLKRFEIERLRREGGSSKEAREFEEWVPEGATEETIVEMIRIVKKDVRIHPDQNLELDLGFESLERVEFLSNVQERLQVDITDEEATELFTVGDVILLAKERLSGDGTGVSARAKSWDEILDAELTPEETALLEERLLRRPFVEFIFIMTAYVTWALIKILFRVKDEGLENLPKDYPFMICPNHVSFLDAFVVVPLLPNRVIRRFFSLGYSDYFAGGIVGFLGVLIKTIPVDADRMLRRALRLGAEGLRRDLVLCVFPEGERSIDGTLKTFRKGPAILATKMNTPVVPVGIIGAYEAWRRGSSKIRLHPITVRFGKPIKPEPGESIDDFNHRLREAVKSLL